MSKKSNGKVKSAFGYFGSKHKIALPIIRYIPPHNAWVDAFCGSAALTLTKEPSPIEIINDLNSEVINFFVQVRTHPDKLKRLVNLTPYSRQELYEARRNGKRISDIERARKFIVSAMFAMNGVFGGQKGGFSYSNSYARNSMEARVSRWYNFPDRLNHVVDRLRKVRVEHQDARVLIRQFIKRPASLIYMDPPYMGDRARGYDHDTDDEFHEELLDLANQARCMILVSGYDNPLYSKLLAPKYGWKKNKIKTTTQGSNGERKVRVELLWQNKYALKALKTQKVPIRLTKREKSSGKINPIRK